MARTIPIRSSLLVSMLSLLVVLAVGILVVSFVGGRAGARRLAAALMEQTVGQTEAELGRFFGPVALSLEVAAGWGENGLLETDNPDSLNALFTPVIEEFPQITSALVADDHGDEFMLLRTDAGWTNRLIRHEAGARAVTWRQRHGDQWTERRQDDLDYDPRARPWYVGAIHAAGGDGASSGGRPVHWTDTYTFFTTRQPGITASTTFVTGQGTRYVVAFDVLLKNISAFTTQLRVGRDGMVYVTDKQPDSGEKVIGLPRHSRFSEPASWTEEILRSPGELGEPLIADAAALLADHPEGSGSPVRFSSSGRVWWSLQRPLPIGPDRTLHAAVLVPESELLGTVQRLRTWIIGIAAGVIVLATLWAYRMARGFSEPIEALVEQSERIRHLDFSAADRIESGISEIQHLAESQDRMRQAMRSLTKLEHDLALARQIQRDALPAVLPHLPGFEIAAWNEPAEQTGGDTFDVIGCREDQDRLVICEANAERAVLLLADATGHGIGPALSVMQVRAMLRMAVRLNTPLEGIARHLNDQLCMDLHEGRFVTAWLGEIDPTTGTLASLSAGQAPLFLYERGSDAFRTLTADVLPLGIAAWLDIGRLVTIQMATGDVFAVISDGLWEATDASGQQFGQERIRSVIREASGLSAEQIAKALQDAVTSFAGDARIADDQTVVLLKRLGDPA